MVRKSSIYYPIAALWVIVDVLTKRWAVPFLADHGGSYPVVGDYLRFTLVMNKGMAFGLSFGEWSRWILVGFVLVTLVLIFHLYRETPANDKIQTVALALITGGAIGNLIDRLRSADGVVDFIDVGFGTHRFYIFNVADAGVSVGGALLVILLWTGAERTKKTEQAQVSPPS